MFDLTINLGSLISTASFIGSGAYFIWSMRTRLEVMDTRQATVVEKISKIETELQKLTEVIIEQAKQTQRLDSFEARLQEVYSKTFSVTRRVKR